MHRSHALGGGGGAAEHARQTCLLHVVFQRFAAALCGGEWERPGLYSSWWSQRRKIRSCGRAAWGVARERAGKVEIHM